MVEIVVLAGAMVIAAGVWRAVPAALDAARRHFMPKDLLRLGLESAVHPERYWWGRRIERMSAVEREAILADAAARRGLARVDNMLCPLCGAEIERALTLTRAGELGARPTSRCPECDFRLDSCRHCGHFQPAQGMGPTGFDWNGVSGGSDFGSGRCRFYKEFVPVEEAGLSADMTRTIMGHGYDVIRAGRPIADSYMPPDFCRAFLMDERRLAMNGVKIDKERKYLLRLLMQIDN